MTKTTNKAVLNRAIAIYVFRLFWKGMETIEGAYADESIYRKIRKDRSGRFTVSYKGAKHDVSYRRVASGVHAVPCIFVDRLGL